jgi:hypothetical protein
MLSFKIKFSFDDPSHECLIFESNEKPFKGEAFHISENEQTTEYKVLDVQKVIVRKEGTSATLEYHCKLEKSDIRSIPIGFK